MKAPAKRQVDVYFDKYAESHQNQTNELIHWICVPLIFFSIIGLIWAIPFPHLDMLGSRATYVNWFSFVMAAVILYYYYLSKTLAFLMIIVIGIMAYPIVLLEQWAAAGGPALWQSSLAIFIVAWIGQFIGHKIEGKKPSFFDDLRFLLIGPIWLLHFVCNKVGLKY
ncbi:MAG: DUF962 domain-containing protein [Chitinophagaceae bacterium]|nr:MAG: DUF962 domain-containing protein [Chitinophagaceae bacterium]